MGEKLGANFRVRLNQLVERSGGPEAVVQHVTHATISLRSLRAWMSGNNELSSTLKAGALAQALGVSLDYLLTGRESMTKSQRASVAQQESSLSPGGSGGVAPGNGSVLTGEIQQEVLREIIKQVEEKDPELSPSAKAKAIAEIYSNHHRHQIELQGYRRSIETELKKGNIRVLNWGPLLFECEKCGQVYSPKNQWIPGAEGRTPAPDFWKCPNGCNK